MGPAVQQKRRTSPGTVAPAGEGRSRESGAERRGPLRVLLADDHPMVRETLVRYVQKLAAEATVVEGGSLEDAIESVRTEPAFDLIVLDLNMPGMDGLAGLERMRRQAPATPVVILTGSADPRDMARSLELGAAGFIPKTMVGKAMVNALRLVLAGERFIPSQLFFRDPVGAPTPPAAGGALSRLTPQQGRVLDLLIGGRSNKEIARELAIEEITVKVHLQRIYRTLGVANRTQAATRALQLGWRTARS